MDSFGRSKWGTPFLGYYYNANIHWFIGVKEKKEK